jgi:hypothetical protein
VDDFRAINAITLCERIVFDIVSGRKFFDFLALFDRQALPPQINGSSTNFDVPAAAETGSSSL